MAKRASESCWVLPEAAAAAAVATTASGTAAACEVSAACWEEGATGAAAAASPCRVAQAVAATPPYLGVTNITRLK